jgi:hypothetical protein
MLYRGLLDSEGNFTGWHLSSDGGNSLTKEGLLPAVTVGGTDTRPSGGDPVVSFSEAARDVYASSLNYDPIDPFANTNGVGIYKSDEASLLSSACDPTPADLSDEDCWPTRGRTRVRSPCSSSSGGEARDRKTTRDE